MIRIQARKLSTSKETPGKTLGRKLTEEELKAVSGGCGAVMTCIDHATTDEDR